MLLTFSAVHRQSRVLAAGHQRENFADRVFQIDAHDFTARHHDVVDGDLLQVEHVEQHVLSAGWQRHVLVDQRAHFILSQMIRLGAPGSGENGFTTQLLIVFTNQTTG